MTDTVKLTTATNRKPADELADVRERIKALKTREEILRTQLIDGEVDLIGDEYRVVISKVKSERVDVARMKKELGTKFLKPYLIQSETTFVKLKGVDGDD